MIHHRRRVVCLCGSARRCAAELTLECTRLTRGGAVVVGPEVYHSSNEATDHDKQRLNELHHRRIEFSDEVLVVNPDGHTDAATRSEIAYAERLGKPITYTHPRIPGPLTHCVERSPTRIEQDAVRVALEAALRRGDVDGSLAARSDRNTTGQHDRSVAS